MKSPWKEFKESFDSKKIRNANLKSFKNNNKNSSDDVKTTIECNKASAELNTSTQSKLDENDAIYHQFTSNGDEVRNVCGSKNEDHCYAMKKYFQTISKSNSKNEIGRKKSHNDLKTLKV